MRNLKRALSLGLASVMLVGMMAAGAGAVSYDDLTDKDEIVNQEAVQMLVELGVIDGKDDGSFDPTGIVTRAEMAKMICIVLNGGSDPNLGTTVSNSYTDTVGHWAAGYIEYCTQLGIVSGDGTGVFNPSGTVTGAEAAKMLLVALGYLSSAEGFTGANWAVAVNVRANQKGLYDGLSINADEGLTRDNAAQMIYNALDADMVQYDYTLVTDGTSLSSSPTLEDKTDSNGNNVTLLANYFNAVRLEGVVIANEYANLNTTGSLDEGKTRIYVTNYDDQGYYEDGSTDFSLTTELEDLGRSVVLYVEKESNSSNAEILGSTIDSGDNLVVLDYSSDTIDEVADDNNLDLIYSGDDRTQVVYNYGGAEGLTSSVATTDYLDGSNTTAGIEKYLIDNDDDGEVEYVLLNTYAFGRVTSYVTSGSGSITVRAGESGTFSKSDMDDVVGFDDVAKDDYVLVAEIGGRLFVEVADTGTSTSDYTNATVFIAGEAEAQDIRVDSGSLEPAAGKVYTYTINSDGYYELDDDNFETGENYYASKYVASSNSDTFVLEDVDDDFVITSDTLFVDDSDYLDDPVGELGAGPDEGDYVTHVVYGDNDDREVIMVVISNEEADGDDDDYVGDDSVSGTNNSILTTEGVEADSVRLSSGGTLTYSFYAPEGYTTSDTVDYYYEVYVEGDLYTYGSVTGASISSSGLVSGSVSDIDYDDGDEVEIVVTEVELVEDDTDATYTVTLSGYDAGTYSLYLNNRAVEPVENRGSLTVEAEEGDELTVESSTLTAGATYDVGLSELVTVDSSNGFTVTVDSSLTLSEPVRTAELAALEADSSADLPAGVTAITAEFESAPDTVQAEDALTITFALEGEFTGTAEGAVAAEITAEGAEISGDTSVEVISAGGSGLAETEITVTIDEITGNTVTLSVDFS